MDIKLLDDSKSNTNVYLLDGVEIALCNSIRRTIIDKTPVLAIENVEIYENDSAHYDEIVAHRLGLVPLVTDVETYNEIRESEDMGNARNEVEFSLNVEGPQVVTSKSLEFKDPGVKPVSEDDPITLLKEGAKLKITGKAVVNKGRVHSKWTPAHVFYTYQAKDASGKSVTGKNIDTDDTIIEQSDKVVLTIESWGQVPPNKLFEMALDKINEDCNDILKEL